MCIDFVVDLNNDVLYVGICCHCCFPTKGGSIMCTGSSYSRVDCFPTKGVEILDILYFNDVTD